MAIVKMPGTEAVAVIGMAGRFPGAGGVEEFWRNIQDGVESISHFSEEELDVFDAAGQAADPAYVKARGVIADADQFDAAFFGMAPKEAEITDPQHRIFLECCWEAFENAGYDPLTFSKTAAVFAGCSPSTYFLQQICTTRDFIRKYTAAYQVGNYNIVAGNSADFLATRVSAALNLKGPSFALNCGYATSLVTVSQACQSLLSHQCDVALAGAVSVTFPQKRGYLYYPNSIVSPDGHCRAFDASAQGTVFGSGAGVVLLKRLSEAIQDRDQIYAVIRGSGANNDGSAKDDFAAPGVEGQAAVITLALGAAGIRPETINYIEAHGTGVPLEDPTEVAALKKVFRRSMANRNLCALGSSKPNVGHLDIAAGAAGLVKACLMLRDKKLPPLLHFKTPNPAMDLENSPFYVNTELSEWPRGHAPRRAGVSAFGEGGTNAHIVLEEAPESVLEQSERSRHLVLVSAKSEQALERATDNLVEFLTTTSSAIADVAYTLQIGRHGFEHRRLAVCQDREDAIQVLSARQSSRVLTAAAPAAPPSVAFLFPGQGSQQVQMGYDLYRTEARFREEMDRCTEILRPHLDLHLTDILYPLDSYRDRAAQQLNQTILAQPAIFAFEYSLARLWMQWGIAPTALLGHGMGEYVAACLAGVLSLEDALMLTATRGRLMQQLPVGEMLSVRLPAHALVGRLEGALSIAAIDGPNNCVVAGPSDAIGHLVEELTRDGLAYRRLAVSHAFHSAMMDPVIEPYVAFVRSVHLSAPAIPYLSGVSGEWVTAAEVTDPEYWGRHLRQPVLFSTALQNLNRKGIQATIEVGSGSVLTSLARQSMSQTGESLILPSVPDADNTGAGAPGIMDTLGRLWLAGSRIDWAGVYSSERRHRVHLPTYPFERKRHWLENVESVAEAVHFEAAPSEAKDKEPDLEPKQIEQMGEKHMTPEDSLDKDSKRKARIQCAVAEIFEEASGINPAASGVGTTFRAMGLDAHELTLAAQSIASKLGVKVALGQLVDQQSTLSALTDYISREMPPEQFAETAVPEHVAAPAPLPGTLAAILSDQLQAMTHLINRQLDVLQRTGAGLPETHPAAPPTAPSPEPPKEEVAEATVVVAPEQEPATPIELTPVQESYLANFIQRYVSRTKKSKDLTQQYRARLADPRAAAGFRAQWKELIYPIVTEHSRGSRLWDLNGNEYIDIVNGFGPTVFGHAPDFVVNAVRSQLDRGFEIGPQSPIAGKVAAMLCEMTGMDRATFCNTGSEAVMAAIRVARTVTGRSRIVMFSGAYHGIFDEVLARGVQKADGSRTVPASSGIPAQNLQNVTVLEYASESSLRWIEEHAAELAAVLVEPVQSRNPGLQPKEFLHELRRVTNESGAALIFDEGTTGFRVHAGGVQALFDIRADLATYGKVLGGGLPIGALAGNAKFMNALDGGAWSFGDDSSPDRSVTFFGGTFVRHPLALAAAEAVLDHLQEQGPGLQERLNAKTGRLVAELNACFEEAGLPARVESFGSIFYFSFPAESAFASLLFYHLRANGVYILEGYPCFLTSAHTENDVKSIAEAFRRSVREMREGGLFPPPPEKVTPPEPDSQGPPEEPPSEISRAAGSGGIIYEESRGVPPAENGDDYWLEQFKEIPAPLDLPSDRSRTEVRRLETATFRRSISAENAHQIECLGLTHGCTLFATLLSGLHAVLQRLASRSITVIGIPVAGQFLPLIARSDETTTVEQFLHQTKRTLVEACDHQAYTPEILDGKPALPVLCHLEHAETAVSGNRNDAAGFDLFVKVTALPDGLVLDCDYSADLFDESTISRWLSHFESFLLNASADATQSVQRVGLMNEKETAAVLSGWSRTRHLYPDVRCIHDLFEEQAAANPAAVAITMEGQQLTYGELNSRANQLARYLRKYGVGPENPVGLCMERSVNMVVGLLGILKAGGGYVPLDPSAPRERLQLLLEEAQSNFILTELALLNYFPAAGTKGVCIDTDWPIIARESEQNPPAAALPDNLFCVIYDPHGTALTHRNVARLFAATDDRFCFEPSDVWALCSPVTSAFAIWEIWGCLLYGGRLVIVPQGVAGESPELSLLLSSEGVTVLNQTPSSLRLLAECGPALRLVILSGKGPSFAVLPEWLEGNTEVFSTYGVAETTMFASYRSVRHTDTGNLIGQPLSDVELYILDRNLNPVPIGIQGELYIGGAGVARGYWKRDDLTQERFLRDPYAGTPDGRLVRTGDLARLLPSGEVEYLGRLKGDGVSVEPEDVESVLCEHAGVLETAVIVHEDEPGDRRLTAYVVPSGATITARDLRAYLLEALPGYGIPITFVLVQNLPLTPDGQVDRNALPAPDNRRRSGREYTAPRTPVEKTLAQIWAEVLRLERVGVDDDILDLGGNSSHVSQISARARAAGIVITPQQLLEQGTIARVLVEADLAGKEVRFRLMDKAS